MHEAEAGGGGTGQERRGGGTVGVLEPVAARECFFFSFCRLSVVRQLSRIRTKLLWRSFSLPPSIGAIMEVLSLLHPSPFISNQSFALSSAVASFPSHLPELCLGVAASPRFAECPFREALIEGGRGVFLAVSATHTHTHTSGSRRGSTLLVSSSRPPFPAPGELGGFCAWTKGGALLFLLRSV